MSALPEGASGDPAERLARLEAEVVQLRRALALKAFQLESLFELSREFATSLDESAVQDVLLASLMGHLMVSRCALFVGEDTGVRLAAARGLRGEAGEPRLAVADLPALESPRPVAGLPPGRFRELLQRLRLELVCPAEAGAACGWLALGPRGGGLPFGDEEQELAAILARQALTVLETVRLHRLRLEKQQQDRELDLAREIQEALLPRPALRLGALELFAESRPCRAVGGDYYDFIPLPERLALIVADVSGKGAPASILMASVHAAIRALAGTLPPGELLQRINRQLYDSTQPHRYVTLFYAECDQAGRSLRYVNAGHVPPWLLQKGAGCLQLTAGGPALGLLEGSTYEVGECRLEAGDCLACVTDGVTEALSPADEEYGAERVRDRLRESAARDAAGLLHGLVEDVLAWVGPAGCGDDLTAVILRVGA